MPNPKHPIWDLVKFILYKITVVVFFLVLSAGYLYIYLLDLVVRDKAHWPHHLFFGAVLIFLFSILGSAVGIKTLQIGQKITTDLFNYFRTGEPQK